MTIIETKLNGQTRVLKSDSREAHIQRLWGILEDGLAERQMLICATPRALYAAHGLTFRLIDGQPS